MESDHACKIKEARDARRKRILARSSERLAYITGEGKPTPLSSPCNPSPSLQLLDSAIARESRKSSTSRSLGFTKEFESCNGTSGSVEATTCGEEEPRLMQNGCRTPQPTNDEPKVSASGKEEAGKSYSRDFGMAATGKGSEMAVLSRRSLDAPNQIGRFCVMAKLSRLIRDSLIPRAACAACVALIFMGIPALTSPVHPRGGPIMNNVYSVLAVVFAMDFLFVLIALGSCSITLNEAEAIKAGYRGQGSSCMKGMNWAVVIQILLSFSLDCSVSASLLGGGLLLSRNLFSASCSNM